MIQSHPISRRINGINATAISNDALLYPRPRHGHPYYIVAPPYAQDSAGVKMLYVLCHLLNLLGAKAYMFVVPYFRSDEDLGPGLVTPALTRTIIERHNVTGDTPIIIASETLDKNPFQGGVVIRWVLNFVGHLGGPQKFSPDERLYCYSDVIAGKTLNNSGKLFLPGSDPNFFVPPAQPTARSGVCYYSGKYVEIHGQVIPASLTSKATKIMRGVLGQSREELLHIFQTHEVLYIFENTALATEALLCGCAVVAIKNEYFDEMIAQNEHGSAGLTWSDTPAAIEAAKREVANFRRAYAICEASAITDVEAFLQETQAIASAHSQTAKLAFEGNHGVVAQFDRLTHLLRQLIRSSLEQGLVRTANGVWKNLSRKILVFLCGKADK